MGRRTVVAVLLLVFAGTVPATTLEGEIAVASAYVWRGFALSDAPSVIGGFEYRHDDGWFGQAEVAGIRVDDTPEQRAQALAGVAKPWGAWVLEGGVIAYEYTRGDRYDPSTGMLEPGSSNDDDFTELFAGARLGRGRFRFYRSEDYLGSGRLGNYYDFNYDMPVLHDARLLLHYGFTDSAAINDHASQLSDFAFGIAKGRLSLAVATLDDNEDGKQSRNPRFVFQWREGLDLLN